MEEYYDESPQESPRSERRNSKTASERGSAQRSFDEKVDLNVDVSKINRHLFDIKETLKIDIDDHLLESLAFRENVIVSCFEDDNAFVPVPVGGLCLNIQISGGKFLVHVTSQLSVDGNNGGSAIIAWVDFGLHTLEEKRNEFLRKEQIEETSLYVGLMHNHYYTRHRSSEELVADKRCWTFHQTKNLVGEGANFLLMRLLAVSKYVGEFEMSTMYINSDLCRNIYKCLGPEGGVVNDTHLDLCKIHRVVIEKCGIVHKCCTVLTIHGQIIKQDWEDCNYVLHVNPIAEIKNEKPTGDYEKISLKRGWETDMQLFSKFLDHKTLVKKTTHSYILDHPEFKNILSDYIQSILLLKPTEILDFTIEHFKLFKTTDLPHNDYYDGITDEFSHIAI